MPGETILLAAGFLLPELAPERDVPGQRGQPVGWQVLENDPGVPDAPPQVRAHPPPEGVAGVTPGPPEIESQLREPRERFRENPGQDCSLIFPL